ncbi:MAG TPA: xanthine dehydrogenase family protein subunit M [Gemmatimonadales bacterium]
MRTAISTLELLEPKTLATALKMLRNDGPLTPLAGCTDLYVAMNFGTMPSRRYLDLSRLGTLRRIRMEGDNLVIGAGATYTEIIGSRLVRKALPMLVSAAREIGGPQIQNRGTLGGNIANGSPAGDSLPVLSAADAVIMIESVDGRRTVPFGAFYTGYRKSVLKPDELITAIEIPPVEGVQWFRKVGTRAAQAISRIVIAAVRAPRPRIALGSVAPTVVRLPKTEAALAAGVSIADAQRVLLEEIHPIDDIRSSAEYRRQVAANLLAQFWTATAHESRANSGS